MKDGFIFTMRNITTYSISLGVLLVLLTVAVQGFRKMEPGPYMLVVIASFVISVFLTWSFIKFMTNRSRKGQ